MAREPTSKVRDILSEKVEQARSGDHFALLDLPDTASDGEIKEAYFRLVRTVHPDSLQKYNLDVRREDATFVFEKVTQAYQTLSDPMKRKTYIQARREGKEEVSPEEANRALQEQAKIALHQGKMLLNRRAWGQAEAFFRQLVGLRPDDAMGWVLLGWSLFQNKEKDLNTRLEEARASFQKAIKLDETNADAHYYLALYYKELGNPDQVAKYIQATLELNRNHVPALREKRLVEMRVSQKPAQPGVGEYLKGLFGKLGKKK